MLVSIIIPSYQQPLLLKRALESIAKQRFKDYEIIVMDGGSKDNTADVIAEFDYLSLKFYSEKDNGIYDAMNKGIKVSAGEYIYFMGCDDRLASESSLEDVFAIPAITANDVIYGNVMFTRDGSLYDGEFNYYKLYIYNISHQAIFTHRTVFEKLGNFDIQYKALADYEFNMRWFDSSTIKRQYVPVTIAIYDTNGFSSYHHDEKFGADQWELKKKHFPKIVRYLAVNQNKYLHRVLAKILTDKHIVALNFMRNWLE